MWGQRDENDDDMEEDGDNNGNRRGGFGSFAKKRLLDDAMSQSEESECKRLCLELEGVHVSPDDQIRNDHYVAVNRQLYELHMGHAHPAFRTNSTPSSGSTSQNTYAGVFGNLAGANNPNNPFLTRRNSGFAPAGSNAGALFGVNDADRLEVDSAEILANRQHKPIFTDPNPQSNDPMQLARSNTNQNDNPFQMVVQSDGSIGSISGSNTPNQEYGGSSGSNIDQNYLSAPMGRNTNTSMTRFGTFDCVTCGAHAITGSCLNCTVHAPVFNVPFAAHNVYLHAFHGIAQMAKPNVSELSENLRILNPPSSSSSNAALSIRNLVAGEICFPSFINMVHVVVGDRRGLNFLDLGSGLGRAVIAYALVFSGKTNYLQHVNTNDQSMMPNNNNSNSSPISQNGLMNNSNTLNANSLFATNNNMFTLNGMEASSSSNSAAFNDRMEGAFDGIASENNSSAASSADEAMNIGPGNNGASLGNNNSNFMSSNNDMQNSDDPRNRDIKSVGVEIRLSLHRVVENQILKRLPDEIRSCCHFVHNDFFQIPCVEADVMFVNATGFDDQLFANLVEKIRTEGKRGARIICLSRPFPTDRNFKVFTADRKYKMTWGNCSVYFHEKIA